MTLNEFLNREAELLAEEFPHIQADKTEWKRLVHLTANRYMRSDGWHDLIMNTPDALK